MRSLSVKLNTDEKEVCVCGGWGTSKDERVEEDVPPKVLDEDARQKTVDTAHGDYVCELDQLSRRVKTVGYLLQDGAADDANGTTNQRLLGEGGLQ